MTKPDYHYHEPFVHDGRPWQRGNQERWAILQVNQNWKGKRVIDYGASSGFFSMAAAHEGAARVLAFDADPESVALATEQLSLIDPNKTKPTFYLKEPGKPLILPESDVLLLLSVVPWILRTEINPWEIVRSLARSAEVAYVELMYAGDGRAGMAEVKNDADAEAWLKRIWPIVYPIGWTKAHSGSMRTIWRCQNRDTFNQEPTHVGAQAMVWVNDYDVMKKARDGREYDPRHELDILHELRFETIAPKPIAIEKDYLVMTTIHGVELSRHWGAEGRPFLEKEANRLLSILQRHGVEHRDIRPENIILGNDGHLYLIDYGWASLKGKGKPVPKTINPDFRGKDDRESFQKIIEHLTKD